MDLCIPRNRLSDGRSLCDEANHIPFSSEAELFPAATIAAGAKTILDSSCGISVAPEWRIMAADGERPKLKAYVDGILSRPSFAVRVARESAFLVDHAAGKAASYSHPAYPAALIDVGTDPSCRIRSTKRGVPRLP
jgi:hypothetical protein